MQQTSAAFGQALRAPHQIACRVDAVRDGVTLASDLEVSSGQVQVDATSATRAQLTAVFPDKKLADVFSGAGVELKVQAGLRFFGQLELLPQGVFPIGSWSLEYGPAGGIKVSCPDRWTVVQRSRFPAPRQWDAAWGSADDAIGALMREPWTARQALTPSVPVPSLTALVSDPGGRRPSTVWARDRDKAVTDLATSLGWEAFFDESGNVMLRPRPQLAATAVWDADASATGVLMAAARSRSWEQVYNEVVVTGVDPSDSQTVTARGLSSINDSTAPLWTGGPFGEVPFFYSSPLIATDTQAQDTAASLLATAASFNATLAATCVPNPALQAGDTIQVTLPTGEKELHVLQGFTLPLNLDSSYAMPLALRSSKNQLPSEASA